MSNKYDFETYVDRHNTGSKKYQLMYERNPNVSDDVVPLNTADMEFRSLPELYRGLSEYLLTEPIFGYTGPTSDVLDAIVNWMQRRHNYEIQPEWILHTPGVVNGFQVGIDAFSEENDGIIIMRPVYFPFGKVIGDLKRVEVNVPLIEEEGYYSIDFEAFEQAAAQPENKVLLFCSPHNPVGRVWKREELERIADICKRHDLFVISDEIWFEFTRNDNHHIMFGSIDEELNERIIMCTAPSKTFNTAGMGHSHLIIPNAATREKLAEKLMEQHQNAVNHIGFQATKLLYSEEGATWSDEVQEVIYHNMQLIHDFFATYYPNIKAPISEGTYVQWVDFRSLGMTPEELAYFLDMEAEFITDHGTRFGDEGAGFERVNCALPTHVLQAQLDRLNQALSKRYNK